MKPRTTTLYIDVPTLRRADEAAQKTKPKKLSRSEYIRQAIREKLERDDAVVKMRKEAHANEPAVA
jgi:metal-responsive CopG/Arc/MetJ family transcriptional regulator